MSVMSLQDVEGLPLSHLMGHKSCDTSVTIYYPHHIHRIPPQTTSSKPEDTIRMIFFELAIDDITGKPVLVGKCLHNNDTDLGRLLYSPLAGWGRITALSGRGNGTVHVRLSFYPSDEFERSEVTVYCVMDGQTTLTPTNTLRINPLEITPSLPPFSTLYLFERRLDSFEELAEMGTVCEMPRWYLELRKRKGHHSDASFADRYQVVEVTKQL